MKKQSTGGKAGHLSGGIETVDRVRHLNFSCIGLGV